DTLVHEGFDEFIPALETFTGTRRPEREPGKVTDAAKDFIERHRDERFFLYLHYMQPHDPYFPPSPYANEFTVDPVRAITPDAESIMAVSDRDRPLKPAALDQLRARYDENLLSVDAEVGRLFDALRALGVADDTVVIIAADHGEAFFEHGLLSHNLSVYDEMTHIPLVLHGPGVQAALGARVEHVVSNVQLYPTICGLFGVQPPPSVTAPPLFEPEPAPGICAYAQAVFPETPQEAYWWPRHKLVRDRYTAAIEVYDLETDPGERVNLAGVYPVLADWLEAEAAAWRAGLDAGAIPPRDDVVISPARREQLEALGYLH
ncbi:MAG: sulfatase-like hydrolase/transferase, partial [Candidatus Hydrogenedentes bacterium]|nr:sulfatase-like hydrolase/transferase [Candidatus Hydrogenedentota bacterium]